MEQTKEPCDYPLNICKPGEPVLFCRKAKPCPIHSNTTEQIKAWYEMAMDAYGNGVEETLGYCHRNELREYTEWIVKNAENRGREQGLREAREMVKSGTPWHITRDYRDTDQMRDDILKKINALLSQQEDVK